MTELIVTLCTCPDLNTAQKIARLLVENKHAACVNVLPGITSVYTWNDQVETAEEHLLVIKSSSQSYQAIENTIRSNHPYEVPEIIALPIDRVLPEYINWINTCRA